MRVSSTRILKKKSRLKFSLADGCTVQAEEKKNQEQETKKQAEEQQAKQQKLNQKIYKPGPCSLRLSA